MIEPTEADIGRGVIYHDRGRNQVEHGIIVRINSVYVFVRYGDAETPKATVRQDLTWEH